MKHVSLIEPSGGLEGGWVGGWVDGWVVGGFVLGWIEEEQAVRMSCCML